MTNGDAAAAAGMDVVPATDDRRNGYDEINKTRDYIASKANSSHNHDIGNIMQAGLPIMENYLPQTYYNKSEVDSRLGAKANTSHSHDIGDIKQAGLPIMENYLPQTYYKKSEVDSRIAGRQPAGNYVTRSPENAIQLRWDSGRVRARVDITDVGGLITDRDNVANRLADNTFTAQNYFPNLYAVASSYIAVYRNGDGRLGISPSAARFKKDINSRTYTLEVLRRIRVVEYRLRAEIFGNANAPVDVGVIAEELIAAGLSEFVVFDDHGEPLSVHYERLVLVAIGAVQDLATQHDALAARVEDLETRITDSEATT